MATRKKSSARKQSSPSRRSSSKRSASRAPRDALALLRADHQMVQDLFRTFEKTRSDDRKTALAEQICSELTVHAQIEEEIFYPTIREAMRDSDLIDEATVEHQSAKDLIAQIEGEKGGELFEARVKVLGEYVNHHVKEEQNEIFPQVRKTKIDLKELGERLMARKEELKSGGMTTPGRSGGKSSGMQGSRSRREVARMHKAETNESEGIIARMTRGMRLS